MAQYLKRDLLVEHTCTDGIEILVSVGFAVETSGTMRKVGFAGYDCVLHLMSQACVDGLILAHNSEETSTVCTEKHRDAAKADSLLHQIYQNHPSFLDMVINNSLVCPNLPLHFSLSPRLDP